MNLSIIVAVILILICGFIYWVYRDDKRQTAENRKRDEAILACINKAIRELNSNFLSELHKNYTKRDLENFDYSIRKAKKTILRYLAANESLTNKLDAWRSSTSEHQKLVASVSIMREARVGYHENALARAQFKTELKQIEAHLNDDLHTCFARLLNKAPADPQAFSTASDLIGRSREWAREFSKIISFISPPSNWTELVGHHMPNPSLSDYHGAVVVTDGGLRLMASEAVEGSGDVTKAKIVLAFCNADAAYRDEVGETRASELADLIIRHHAQHPII